MSRKLTGVVLGCVLGLAFFAVAPNMRASEEDQATQLTFHQAVELPGNVVLPAGTYWFVLPTNVLTNHDVVQVMDADRTNVIATMKTARVERFRSTDDTQLTLAEASGRRPMALMTWYYPSSLQGHEFVYSTPVRNRLSEDRSITVIANQSPLVTGSQSASIPSSRHPSGN